MEIGGSFAATPWGKAVGLTPVHRLSCRYQTRKRIGGFFCHSAPCGFIRAWDLLFGKRIGNGDWICIASACEPSSQLDEGMHTLSFCKNPIVLVIVSLKTCHSLTDTEGVS